MANPAAVSVRTTGALGSDVAQLVTQVNNLTTNLRILTAKLDLDAGVTDTNYAALVTDGAVATSPAIITATI
jgi:hypothetical protein